MKAYRITWADKRSLGVDLGYRYQLPRIECRECSQEWGCWGDGMFEFPAFRFEFLNEQEYSFSRVVTLATFDRMKRKVESAAGRVVNLIPGCSIGELSGVAMKTTLGDFVWGRVTFPQISRRARDLLALEGVELLTGECALECRGRRLDSHLAIQAEPVALLTQDSLDRLGISRCARCGRFIQPKPQLTIPNRADRNIRRDYRLNKSAWPSGQHLLAMSETPDVLASAEFMAAVTKHKLMDMRFEECGRFV